MQMKSLKTYQQKINNIFIGNKTDDQIKLETNQFLASLYKTENIVCSQLYANNQSTQTVSTLVSNVGSYLEGKLKAINTNNFFDLEILLIELH